MWYIESLQLLTSSDYHQSSVNDWSGPCWICHGGSGILQSHGRMSSHSKQCARNDSEIHTAVLFYCVYTVYEVLYGTSCQLWCVPLHCMLPAVVYVVQYTGVSSRKQIISSFTHWIFPTVMYVNLVPTSTFPLNSSI